MQIPEPITTFGYFWTAHDPSKIMWGTLSISAQGKATLEIFEVFDSHNNPPAQERMGQRLRILGATDKIAAVTLVDCLVLQEDISHNNWGQFAYSSLQVAQVLWGAHIDAGEIDFSAVTFSIEGLDEWFLSYHRPFSSSREPAGLMSLTYRQPERIAFEIPRDFVLGFQMSVGNNLGWFHQAVTTKMSISISSSQPRFFSEYIQVMRKVKNFLCLAFDRTVSFTSITGYRQEMNSPSPSHETVEIYGSFDPYDLPKQDISPGNFLFSFAEIAPNIADYLPRWLERYEEYEPTFNLYFAVAANRHMHLEGAFLFLVHGIESLHRRSTAETQMPVKEFDSLIAAILQSTPAQWKQWMRGKLKYANEPSLRRRIRHMVAPFEDLFGAESGSKAFVNQVVNTRNYLTHYDDTIKDEAATEPQKLLGLHRKLEALLQLHLLQLLGLERDQIRSIAIGYPPLREKIGIE